MWQTSKGGSSFSSCRFRSKPPLRNTAPRTVYRFMRISHKISIHASPTRRDTYFQILYYLHFNSHIIFTMWYCNFLKNLYKFQSTYPRQNTTILLIGLLSELLNPFLQKNSEFLLFPDFLWFLFLTECSNFHQYISSPPYKLKITHPSRDATLPAS